MPPRARASEARACCGQRLRGRLRDMLQGVWLGHPLHPAVIDLPIGAWVSAAVLDGSEGVPLLPTALTR